MSRQNKINPAHYTQRGRLTQDDAARELARQRSIGSQHTWQPVKRNALPILPFKNEDADRSVETSEDTESPAMSPSRGKAKPAERLTTRTSTKTAALTKAKLAKTAKTSTANAKTRTVKKTSDVGRVPRSGPGATAKGKTGRVAKPEARTAATKTTRKAVLARSVGGPALKPLRAAKRRKA